MGREGSTSTYIWARAGLPGAVATAECLVVACRSMLFAEYGLLDCCVCSNRQHVQLGNLMLVLAGMAVARATALHLVQAKINLRARAIGGR